MNMQKNIIFIILFIVVLATGFLLSYKYPQNKSAIQQSIIQSSSPIAVRTPSVYKNDLYKFSFTYPFNLQLKESSPTAITIGTINDLETDSDVEVKIIDSIIKTNATESAALSLAKKLCKSTMHNKDISCTKVINEKNEEIATVKSNIKTFYLEEVTKNIQTGEVISTQNKGPFITVFLTKTKTIETSLLFYPPLEKDPHLINAQLIRDIATSTTLIK